MAAWISDLKRRLGEAVVDDPDVVASYAVDWTGRFVGIPYAVVRPRRPEDVVEVLTAANDAGFGVVPQGGNTGLVGGTAAPSDSVILNLAAFAQIDDSGPHLDVGAGVTIARLHEHARKRGGVFGLDLASRDSATAGGAFATNAAGLHACRYGRMADQVVGLQAVFGDGQVVDALDRPAFGVDPVPLLAGSEGTLGIVTALRLRLHPLPGPTMVTLTGHDSIDDVLAYLERIPGPLAAEVFGALEMEAVAQHTGRDAPLAPSPWYLLIEIETDRADALDPACVVGDGLWAFRDRITETLATRGVVHKFDVVVPPDRLERLIGRLRAVVAPCSLYVFGHISMADFHLNVTPVPGRPVPDSVDEVVMDAVEEAGGQVVGEHGVGRAKAARARAHLLSGQRHLADAIKRALDPAGILNPGAGVAVVR